MDKRFQVFVSSTFVDLKEERQKVFQALSEMDCIPVGMELFPAADVEQWEFIKRVIDDCDYYVLIIGGRYGSVTSDDEISYTEKEFDYAVSKGIRVIVLIHEDPTSLPAKKTDQDDDKRQKLASFTEKAKTNRLVKFWKSTDQISGLVMSSMMKTIKIYPAIGWVRADKVASTKILEDFHELQKRYNQLKVSAERQIPVTLETKSLAVKGLANIDEEFTFRVSGSELYTDYEINELFTFSWKEIFSLLAPHLESTPDEKTVSSKLARAVLIDQNIKLPSKLIVELEHLKTISVQLRLYNLIEINNRTGVLRWSLTEIGKKQLLENRAIKTKNPIPKTS